MTKHDDPLAPKNVREAAAKRSERSLGLRANHPSPTIRWAAATHDHAFAAGVAYALRAIRNGAEVRE